VCADVRCRCRYGVGCVSGGQSDVDACPVGAGCPVTSGPLRRAEQRVNGELYLRGLLTRRGRKSMQPMADRLGGGSSAVTAVRVVLDVGPHGGAGQPGPVGTGRGRPERVRGRQRRLSQGRRRLARGGPPVLWGVGQDRQLPGRRQRAPGHRHRLGGGELAAARRFGPRSADVSAGSARCAVMPALAISSGMYRQPLQPSIANATGPTAVGSNRVSQSARCSRSAGGSAGSASCG
jgi:hypothetical protein